jgi:hypothetical protein
MAWHSYPLTYRLLSPLHVGYRRLGNIQRTRYYLPGRNLWGAITARLTRACYPQPQPADYLAVGDYVRDHIIAGYFYPKLADSSPYYPRLESARWRYGELSASNFEARFIGSFGSTALAASTWTAEEVSLHEIEFIAPKAQTGSLAGCSVYLQGHLYLDQDHSAAPPPLQDWDDTTTLEHLQELFVGGEQGYGFGHMVLQDEPAALETASDSRPQPRDLDGPVLRAHLRVQRESSMKVMGPLEPLVGREWADGRRGELRRGAGQDVSEAVVAWVPGCAFEGDASSLVIAPYGLWEHVP